jgi:hypothetical protein
VSQVSVIDSEFVVAVLELMSTVEELLFEFGNPLPESADFVGSREAGVEDLFAEDFGQALAELGVGSQFPCPIPS